MARDLVLAALTVLLSATPALAAGPDMGGGAPGKAPPGMDMPRGPEPMGTCTVKGEAIKNTTVGECMNKGGNWKRDDAPGGAPAKAAEPKHGKG